MDRAALTGRDESRSGWALPGALPDAGAALRWLSFALAVAAILWIGLRAAMPPRPLPANAPATLFSATRAYQDVRRIAVRPHPTTSADNDRVRRLVAERLRSLGLATEERRYLADPEGVATLRRWSGRGDPASELVDLVGVLPGQDRQAPAVALMAHLDTVWGSPGGGDDSVGVASILEILRAIRARGVPRRDVLVVLTDGEEIGLSGARAFWPGDGLAAHAGVVINLEARGAGGRAVMFETGRENGAMMALFAASVPRAVANSMSVMAYRLMPNYTDFTVAKDKGLPGFNFAVLGRAQYYHSPLATADRLDPATLQDMGDQALGIASALAFARALPPAAPDAAFFDVAGHGVLHYGAGAGWWIVLGALLAFAAAFVGARRAGVVTARAVARGLAGPAWLVAHGLLGLIAFNLFSGSAHANYYDRLAALPRLETQAALVCGAALLGVLTLRRWPRRAFGLLPALLLALLCLMQGGEHGLVLGCAVAGMLAGWFAPAGDGARWGGWLAALGFVLVVAIGLQAKAPMAAWIFAWPALILSIAAAAIAWTDPRFNRPWGWPIAALAAVPVLAPLLPVAHLAFLGVGASMAFAMAAFLPLAGAAFWPLGRIEGAGRGMLLAVAALLVAAGAIAVQVRTDPIADTIPPYALDK